MYNVTTEIFNSLGDGKTPLELITAALFSAMFLAFNDFFLSLFMKEGSSEIAYETGGAFMNTVSLFYFVVCSKLICDGILRGSGKMGFFMAATFTDLILRVVLAFVFSRFWQQNGIWSAWPISWFIAAVMSVVFCAVCLNIFCGGKKHRAFLHRFSEH